MKSCKSVDDSQEILAINRKLAFGLISYTRFHNDGFSFFVHFAGIPIFSRSFIRGIPTYKILFFKKKLTALQRSKRLIEDVVHIKHKEYRTIYVLFNNLGETRFSLEYFKCNLPDNCLFVYTKKYHEQLLEMILPGTDRVFYPEYFSVHLQKDAKEKYIIGDCRIILLGLISYFKRYERLIGSSSLSEIPHFYINYMREVLGVQYTVEIPPLVVQDLIFNSAKEKLNLLIGGSKFVIICNETFSNQNLTAEFYQELCRSLYKRGYKILFNSTGINKSNSLGISSYLSIQELVAISAHAEFVIGIRSGIFDLLSSNCSRIVALYTPFRVRSGFESLPAEKVLHAFSLKMIPFKNTPRIDEVIIDNNNSLSKNISKIFGVINGKQ